jgi:DIM1 family U5 snRNP protein
MSYLLPHLHTAWDVDRSIVLEEKRVVVVRFGRDEDATCMAMDDALAGIAESVKNFAVIFLVNIGEVPDFNDMYELYDPCTVMFFFRNKHIMCVTCPRRRWPRAAAAAGAQRPTCASHARSPPTPAPACRCDCGTGNNNTVTWVCEHQDLIDIIETVYRGARKGRGLVVSPKDYSTRFRY